MISEKAAKVIGWLWCFIVFVILYSIIDSIWIATIGGFLFGGFLPRMGFIARFLDECPPSH